MSTDTHVASPRLDRSPFSPFVVLLLASTFGLGCGRGGLPPQIPVSGYVSCGGMPVQGGEVRFVPLHEGDTVPTKHAVISDGRYELPAAGGLLAGSYRVEVDAREKTGRKVRVDLGFDTTETDETARVSADEYLGPQSPLRYEAKGGGDHQFDIEIEEASEPSVAKPVGALRVVE